MDYAVPTDDVFVVPTGKKARRITETQEQRDAIIKAEKAKVKTEDDCVANYIFK